LPRSGTPVGVTDSESQVTALTDQAELSTPLAQTGIEAPVVQGLDYCLPLVTGNPLREGGDALVFESPLRRK